MERLFARDIGSLGAVLDFVASFYSEAGIAAAHAFGAQIIVEELFTNSVKYSPGPRPVGIRLEREGDRLVICLTDHGGPGFDLRRAPEVDVTAPTALRRPGGLGIHLVRQLADSISYESDGDHGTVTIRTRLEGLHA